MINSFRTHHLLEIFDLFEKDGAPLDLFLRNYFRAHKAIGSKDRRYLADTIYSLIRWKGLYDHVCKSEKITWENRFYAWMERPPEEFRFDEKIPLHIRMSFPKSLFDMMVKHFGEDAAASLCITCNTPAPTTIRVNILKIARDDLLKRWKDQLQVKPTEHSPNGITLLQKINFFGLPEFREGLFEVQDEGSQLVSELMQVKEGDWVLDFCAGSGGKTLAFAPRMNRRGQIYLHDIRPAILLQAKLRLNRAGIQNAQFLQPDPKKKKPLKNRMDWVLVDAPCSGTGTIRRNPDLKWKFRPEQIDSLVAEQRAIFEEALTFLKPGGQIVYATCSILDEENQAQINYFKEKHLLTESAPSFRSLPKPGGMDGFFAAVLKRI